MHEIPLLNLDEGDKHQHMENEDEQSEILQLCLSLEDFGISSVIESKGDSRSSLQHCHRTPPTPSEKYSNAPLSIMHRRLPLL